MIAHASAYLAVYVPGFVDLASFVADKPTWFDNPTITKRLWPATLETIYMTAFSSLITIVLGLPLGLALVATSKRGIWPNRALNSVLGAIVNIGRSIPFIILMIALIPLTRAVMQTAIGWTSAVLPLAVAAIPFFARLVETSVLAVDPGKVEAATMMGATNRQVMFGVQLREALPGIIQGVTVLVITVVGYSAIAGVLGGGGLGTLAYNYGYQRYQADTMIATVVVIVALVQLVQMLGDMCSRLVDHR
ncbi:MAG: methionine ABC transporter permease [Bowdeniella nasicola]|nr:methionine ABC transporter permease [Bowdeniella nasicola]